MNFIVYLAAFFSFSNIYDYTLTSGNGGTINMGDYAGKKILVVNIASSSVFASSQLNKLEALYQAHKDSLVVIGVPSNDFGNEPLTDTEIHQLLDSVYHVHFPIASRSQVSGSEKLSLFQWLTLEQNNGRVSNPVTGDFQKFLINGEGDIIGVFASEEDPLISVENAITQN